MAARCLSLRARHGSLSSETCSTCPSTTCTRRSATCARSTVSLMSTPPLRPRRFQGSNVPSGISHPVPGDIVYLDVCGQPMIILGTHEAAIDLLEKRYANYSDRAPSAMVELYVLPSTFVEMRHELTIRLDISAELLGRPSTGLWACRATGRGGSATGVRCTSTSTQTW